MQDTDGSYFENFTALSWRHENRRLAALRLVEARSERPPPAPHDLGLPSVSAQLSHKEHEHLYTEVYIYFKYLLFTLRSWCLVVLKLEEARSETWLPPPRDFGLLSLAVHLSHNKRTNLVQCSEISFFLNSCTDPVAASYLIFNTNGHISIFKWVTRSFVSPFTKIYYNSFVLTN